MGTYLPPTDIMSLLNELSAFSPAGGAPSRGSLKERVTGGVRNAIETPMRTGRVGQRSPVGQVLGAASDQVGDYSALLDQIGSAAANVLSGKAAGKGATSAMDWLTSDPVGEAPGAAPVLSGAAAPPAPAGLRVGSPEWMAKFPQSADSLTPSGEATHGVRPEDLEFEHRFHQDNDANARQQVLAGGFRATPDPWETDGSAAQMMIDMGAHELINQRDAQARAGIDAQVNDPAKRTLEAHQANAAIEQLMPTERPTQTSGETQGAFDVRPDGTFVNAPPQMRVGEARDIQQGAVVRQSMLSIQQGLTNLETKLADEVKKGVRTQQDADETYSRAERRAGMLMQGIMQGKSDFSGFFKKGSGLEELLLAAGAGGAQPAPAR